MSAAQPCNIPYQTRVTAC